MKYKECMFRDCLKGGLNLSVLVITTFPYYLFRTGRAYLCQSSRLRQFKCFNMSQHYMSFGLLVTNISSLRWTLSRGSISSLL